jgi:hypothetical protein
MATTQQVKPNGGKNAVLKPLNIGPKAGFRTRRSSDQVLQAKITRQQALADKAQKRAKTLAATMQRAQERAAAAAKKAQEIAEEAARKEREEQERQAAEAAQQAAIANGQPVQAEAPRTTTVMAVERTPEVEKLLKNVAKDFDKFFKHLYDTYAVRVEAEGPELVKRGYISLKLRGYMQPQRRPVETAASQSETGVAREAVRFMQHYKTVGLTPAWLNKEVRVKDDPHTYLVTGLRGKAHHVVLRRKDDPAQAFTIPSADFKKVLQN